MQRKTAVQRAAALLRLGGSMVLDVIFLVAAVSAGIWLLAYRDPRSFWTGLWLLLWQGAVLYGVLQMMSMAERFPVFWAVVVLVTALLSGMPLVLVSFLVLWAKTGLRLFLGQPAGVRGRRGFVLGGMILGWTLLVGLAAPVPESLVAGLLVDGITLVVLAFYGLMVVYTMGETLCRLQPAGEPEVVIVLGSSLEEGRRVPPLLAARLELGLAHYRRKKGKGRPVLLLLSGGKGPGDRISEAAAMKAYLLEKGVPAGDLLLEDRSVNTRENALFCRDLLKRKKGADFRKIPCLLVTSRFHLFRALIWSKAAGLRCRGKGSSAPLWIELDERIREYGGVLFLYRRTIGILLVLMLGVRLAMVLA